MDTEKIVVTNDDGVEKEFDILFTFEDDESKKTYVLYYDSSLEEPEVYSSIYDEEGHLYPVDTPEEWDLIEEVFNTFISQDEEE